MAFLDPTVANYLLFGLCYHCRSFVDREFFTRRVPEERSAHPYRRAVCTLSRTHFDMAYNPAHDPFHEARIAETHHPNLVDGPNLRRQCGESFAI